MRPAFSSPRQAAAFALLLLALLLAPALAQKILPSREAIYSSIWWASGDFPYMDGQIFQEKGDVDIVFMGSSHIWAAFDTPYVQEQLSKELGRPSVARTFGWAWPGYDPLYFVAKDLLVHRHVRMLVFEDDFDPTGQPHPIMPHLYRYGEDPGVLDGLSASLRSEYYFAAIAGMPRNFLDMVRPNLPADLNIPSYWEIHGNAPNLPSNLGAITTHIGYTPHGSEMAPFVAFTPQTSVTPDDVCIYSEETKTNFAFSSAGLPPMELHFIQKFAALARDNGCKLVVIHNPKYDERHSTVISEPVFWPDILPGEITMIGIPPATLYRGLSDDDTKKLYSDYLHLNANGQRYFTTLMTPALLKIYESKNQNP
jgi:hypothetical protein